MLLIANADKHAIFSETSVSLVPRDKLTRGYGDIEDNACSIGTGI